uniref:HAUS augmin like complex subunit 3 n=1 Tax=Pavo cristatus TaxID=9049 RepID=A0A8C9FZ21_PAVCR
MSCGKEFVEILKKIGYPKANELNGEDFDWLFESSEDKSFLEWFCGTVNEQHVLSEKELQDFNHLLESGKPILEGNALDEVLKTCKPADSGNSSQEEEEELKKLEDEFQTLQKMKNLMIHQHNKLQMMTSENSSMLQTLKIKEEEAQKDVKEGLELFTAANNKLNNELLSLVDRVKKLASFFTASEQGSDLHPVFFSQLSLDKYLSQEEHCTAALASYAKKHFYRGMSELAENLHEDNVELADISKHVTCAEATEACGKSQEIASLQAAFICAQRQLIELQAEEGSLNSAIDCAASMLRSLRSKVSENIEAKISSLNDEISTVKQEIAQINNEDLPSLLKEHARLFAAPAVMADLDREIAQQDRFASKQDEICSHLTRQKASFELIQLAYDSELKKHKDIHCQLENLIESLKQSSNEMQQRLEALSKQAELAKPRNAISSKDGFSCRNFLASSKLHQMERNLYVYFFKDENHLKEMVEKLEQQSEAKASGLEDENFTTSEFLNI